MPQQLLTFIGVDPGVSGAIAKISLRLREDGAVQRKSLETENMDKDIYDLVGSQGGAGFIPTPSSGERVFILLEEPPKSVGIARPGAHMMTFGMNFGTLYGILRERAEASGGSIKLSTSLPSIWQKRWGASLELVRRHCKQAKLGVRVTKDMHKRELWQIAIREAQKHFGEGDPHITRTAADALLLAILCMEKNLTQTNQGSQ